MSFLADNLNKFMAAASKRKEIGGLSTTFLPAVPQVFIKVDRDKVLREGVNLAEVYRTLQCYMGGIFVNYFNRFGRQWQVYVEAEAAYRSEVENLDLYYVRNRGGGMVPLSALTKVERRLGPEFTMRYNLYRSAQINGAAAPATAPTKPPMPWRKSSPRRCRRRWGTIISACPSRKKKAEQGGAPAAGISGFRSCVFRLPDPHGGPV